LTRDASRTVTSAIGHRLSRARSLSRIGRSMWKKRAKTRLEEEVVVGTFEDILLRPPQDHEIRHVTTSGLDRAELIAGLHACAEHRQIVGLLRVLLRRESRAWLHREPTKEEIRAAVDRIRSSHGSDENLRQAIADGWSAELRPLALEMDITNQCNLRCVMCSFSHPSYYSVPRRHLSVAKFTELAAQLFDRVHRVSLSYGTEPLLHKDIEQFFAILSRHRVPYTFMNTNGLLLRESLIESMVEHGFSSLFVSVDAATPEMYERIRVGGDFAKLMRNLELLRATKRRLGVEHPSLLMGFVLMRHNLHELPAFVDLAADLGAIGVNAIHMASFELIGNHELAATFEKERCNDALATARERAVARGIEFVGPRPFLIGDGVESPSPAGDAGPAIEAPRRARDFGVIAHEKPGGRSCPFPWNFVAIDKSGDVLPCGWWQGEEPMGNIHEQDFLSIWRNERFEDLRRRHLEHRLEGACSVCPAAGMGTPDAGRAFEPR
jgi:radical SAM protein with 4Fe4S-binding SPASM domain